MKTFIGYEEALQLTLARVPLLDAEEVALAQLAGRVLARDVVSLVDSPSIDGSLKDGYAVLSADLAEAGRDAPVRLRVRGAVTAGGEGSFEVSSGVAVRATTGAEIPEGSDAVLAEEFVRKEGETILCLAIAEAGRNVLLKGTDVRKGEVVAHVGERVSAPLAGLMACAGFESAPVYRRPRVGVFATGDEIVAPGKKLPHGKLYASNLTEVCAWLAQRGLQTFAAIAGDDRTKIEAAVASLAADADVLITSGGAWTSERDLIIAVMESAGWEGIYHRVRMGPGKGIGFGLLGRKPMFCLPGGPPSCEIAFLQLALPGILKMQGLPGPAFSTVEARLDGVVRGQSDWTQFIHAALTTEEGQLVVRPAKLRSRLQSMARKNALIVISEGVEELSAGAQIQVQDLRQVEG